MFHYKKKVTMNQCLFLSEFLSLFWPNGCSTLLVNIWICTYYHGFFNSSQRVKHRNILNIIILCWFFWLRYSIANIVLYCCCLSTMLLFTVANDTLYVCQQLIYRCYFRISTTIYTRLHVCMSAFTQYASPFVCSIN